MRSTVVRASIDHVEAICDLSQRVAFHPDSDFPHGSLGYTLRREDVIARLTSPFFYISMPLGRKMARKPCGFVLAYDGDFLSRLVGAGLFRHDGVLPFLFSRGQSYLYGEAIAVEPAVSRKGIGERMMASLFASHSCREMHALCRHTPPNAPGIRFVESLDFSFTGETVQNSGDNYVWGIYSKEFPSYL